MVTDHNSSDGHSQSGENMQIDVTMMAVAGMLESQAQSGRGGVGCLL